MIHHTIVDHLFFSMLLAIPLVEWKWSWPRYLARLASGAANVRLRYFRNLIIGEWVPTLALLTFWAMRKRPWSALRLSTDAPFSLGLGLAYVLALIGLLVWQRRALLARPDRRARIRKAFKHAEPLLPHSEHERHIFWIVSATAGFCEEVFYRGFLTWYLSAWIGPIAAVLLASAIFGAGHVYLGVAQVPKTALIGLILAVVVGITGSLWPAMLLHAAIDWNSGDLGFKLLSLDSTSELSPA